MDVKVTMSNDAHSESTSLPIDGAFSEFSTPLRWLIKLGIIALAILTIVLGVVTMISFSACFFSGLVLIIAGLLTIAIEAPVVCNCVKFIEPLTKFMENVKPWMKFVLYLIPGVLSIVLCQSVSSIFGGLAMIMISAAYFMTFMSRSPKKQQSYMEQTDNKPPEY